MLTCCNRYRIDPAKREAFAEYARAWVTLTNRHGGVHHGFYGAAELARRPASSYPGMSAETAGIWMPAPAERTAIVRKISHTAS